MYYPGTCHACYHMLWHVVSTEVQFNTISTSWEYCCCSCLSLLLRLPTSAICLVFDGETCFLGQFVCVQLHPSSPVCVCVCVCVCPPYLTQSKSRPASDQSFGAPPLMVTVRGSVLGYPVPSCERLITSVGLAYGPST